MGTIECSQPASKSSWDSQDFGDISTVLKMAHFRKSTRPRWVNKNMAGVRMVVFSLKFVLSVKLCWLTVFLMSFEKSHISHLITRAIVVSLFLGEQYELTACAMAAFSHSISEIKLEQCHVSFKK